MHPDLYAVVHRQHEAEIAAAAERRRQVAERSEEIARGSPPSARMPARRPPRVPASRGGPAGCAHGALR
ncbi:hypothetical protein [Isoptericola variabilis]|uniref:Uncharacterized protein n=1 Tax=Isoptericola variabilis (strain 225) TaxID=743718 RepID=F6FXJ2_ISOV2|nr:hypothetical protein [Isoptericola variabilis]AEG44720.1 hypothetical protein Isova_1983 [Isoptericola variabilis 225]TWH27135.1 hypothetical protein L600_005200000020 [Isoptericola variabilis J7]